MSQLFTFLANVMLPVTLAAFLWSGYFWLSSVEAVGTVVAVTAHNVENRGKVTTSSTVYEAKLEFDVGDWSETIEVPAGRAGSYNSPKEYADYAVGQQVSVLYTRRRGLVQACRNTVYDVFFYPIWALVVLVLFVFGAWFSRPPEPRLP